MEQFKNDFSITNRLKFMTSYQLTPNEFDVMNCIYMAQDHPAPLDNEYHTELPCPGQPTVVEPLIQLAKIMGQKLIRECLLSLQEKGLIVKSCKLPAVDSVDGIVPNDVIFNKTVLKQHLKHSGEMIWELFWAYPKDIIINGMRTEARRFTENYQGGVQSLDDLGFRYGSSIKFNPETHKRIIDVIETAKEQGLINCTLLTFIKNYGWIGLEETLNGELGNKNTETKFE